MSIRALRPGDAVPEGEPSRYLNDRGYVRLRWLVAPAEYVEVYEHRLVAGMPPKGMQVHHINGDKTDNRCENLVVLGASDHAILHAVMEPQVYKGPSRQPLSAYPRCVVGGCDRPAQCRGRELCLMHYKRWKRHGSTDLPNQGRRAA